MSSQRRSYFRVACSVLEEPWDDNQLATMIRLSALMVNRWARNKLTAQEACTVRLRKAEVLLVTGRERFDKALIRLRCLADVVSISLSYEGEITVLTWPKFAEFQGFAENPRLKSSSIEAISAPAPAPAPARDLKIPMSSTSSTDVDEVFGHWQETFNKHRAVLDPKRRKLIRRALEAYDVETLKRAISGYRNSPHHMGHNSCATKYVDLELLLRDAKHIDAGIAFHEEPPKPSANGHVSPPPPGPRVPGVEATRAILERLRS